MLLAPGPQARRTAPRTAAALAEAARSAAPATDALPVVRYWAGLTVRPVAEIVMRGRLPVDLRPWLALVRRHPAAGVSDL